MRIVAALLLMALPASAQTFGLDAESGQPLRDFTQEVIEGGIVVEELDISPGASQEIEMRPRQAPRVAVEAGPGAVLRWIDKVTGEVRDVELGLGEAEELGRITVELEECRYPQENPAGDAFALMRIMAEGLEEPAFEGWMIASSPALSALDHPRYDVWVIRCKTA